MKSKTSFVSAIEPLIFKYRGLLKCGSCGRTYAPYIKKGNHYYRPMCKEDCTNPSKNISERKVTKALDALLESVFLKNEELLELEKAANAKLGIITDSTQAHVNDLKQRQTKANEDLAYLLQDKVNLLRTRVFTPQQILEEEERLRRLIRGFQAAIDDNGMPARQKLDTVISFSDLIGRKSIQFKHGLDSEKRSIVDAMFCELSYVDGKLKYVAKPGFDILLRRSEAQFGQSCCPDYLVIELLEIYPIIKDALEELKHHPN